jgi:hypothetical protein
MIMTHVDLIEKLLKYVYDNHIRKASCDSMLIISTQIYPGRTKRNQAALERACLKHTEWSISDFSFSRTALLGLSSFRLLKLDGLA